jgi:hypothetical protein
MKTLPDDFSICFIYKSQKNGDVVVLNAEDARRMDASAAMRRGEYKHVSSVDPICILQLIVNTSGRRRNQIIKELSEKEVK